MSSPVETDVENGVVCVPSTPFASALVLSGSSGRSDVERARLLARHGVAALALRYFGGIGQPSGLCEIPLETFYTAVDTLAQIHPRVVLIGVSKGAEAALSVAATDSRVSLVVAIAPSSVIWANVGASADGRDRPARSSWTRGGEPLPFVPYDDSWMPDHHHGETAFRGLYKQSLRTYASHVPAAVIPVEDIGGHVLLVAGGDDRVWPSLLFAEQIRKRRKSAGRSTIMVTGEAAGHRVPFPGEAQPAGGMTMARGGTEKEDRALGERAWAVFHKALDL